MSLRQLKFKPKLQLNSSLKNKTDENSSSPSLKEVSNRNSTSTTHNNSSSNSIVEADIVKNSSPIKINVSKDDTSPQEVTSLKTPDYYNLSGSAELAADSNISKLQNGSASIIPGVDLSEPLITNIAKFNCNEVVSNTVDASLDKIEVHGNSGCISEEGVGLLLSCNVSENDDSDADEDFQLPGSGSDKKKQNHLINYDVLEKISSKDKQSDSLCSDALNKIDNGSILKDSVTNENVITSSDLPQTLSKDEKTELPPKHVNAAVEFVEEHSSVKVPRLLHKPNLGLSKNCNANVSENAAAENAAQSNCEGKNTKIRKNENKGNISSKKVGTHQRANFKPNLTTLGKIRRPEKFTMSSYSKMESIAKEQFIKKFGKEQEPDTSRLTMMDLIFYNPSSNPMSQSIDEKNHKNLNNSTVEKKEQEKTRDISPTTERKSEEQLKDGDDAIPVPQLTISADGKVIVSQESLVIKPSQNLMNCNFETVIDGEFKKKKPVKNPNRCGWSHLDTIKFYKALNSLGCDFETMQTLFPGRSRRNLKSKFKKEEKLHGSLINKVLSHHSEFDLTNVVRELEIDSVYQSTIKDYGRGLSENGKRPGRKKSLSSVVAGKSSEKDDEGESDDDFIDDDEFPRRKRKADPAVISKISNVLGLNDTNDLNISEIKNKLSKSDVNDVPNMKEVVLSKRKRRKSKENVESDNDMENDRNNSVAKQFTESEGSKHTNLHNNPKNLRKRKKPHSECLPNKNVIIRLEDLIDFNEGVENEPQTNSKTEINENHIVINTNIEFEHVKYTRYISYNSSNLENPIEINETVAHVD